VNYNSVLIIYANGKEIFNSKIPNSKKWQEFKADISGFAGQKVIFHFEFGYETPEQVHASVTNHYIHIGNLKVK
jgi:hypothetical protein